MSNRSEPGGAVETIQSIKQASEIFADAFTQKDVNAIAPLLQEAVAYEDPAFGRVEGKQSLVKLLQDQLATSEYVDYRLLHLFQDDQTTLLEFHMTVDRIDLYGVDIIEWQDQKIKEIRRYTNPPK